MNDYFNVREFGAKGDGTTNDAAKIQKAIDALPAGGGNVYFPPGTYKITSTLTLPDKDVTIEFSSGSKVTISGAISAFTVPDGLTALRLYQIIGRPIFQGDPASAQTLFVLDDDNGRGDIVLRNAQVDGIATFVDWTKYDETYVRQSNVWVYDSQLNTILGGSVLVKAPNAGGSFSAAVALRFCDVTSLPWIVPSVSLDAWTANADCDFWAIRCDYFHLEAGTKLNGIMSDASLLVLAHTGDVEFFGNAWDVYDFICNGSALYSTNYPSASGYADARLICDSGQLSAAIESLTCVALKCKYSANIEIGACNDALGLTNPGIELLGNRSTVSATHFRKVSAPATVFPAGCIKITGVSFCKIHDNDFATTVTGGTVIETGAADKNIIHDNTGYASGTGSTIIGAGTIQHDNIN